MSNRYIPPHRRHEEEDVTDVSTEGYQRAAWQALSRTVTGIINRVTAENVQDSATQLFRENLVRGRGLLARSLMRAQQMAPDLSPVLCSLVSRINKDVPHVVLLLCQRLVVNWQRAYLRKDWQYLENLSRFLACLYMFQVIEVDVIYQVIIAHLTSETFTDEDVDQAAKMFHATFKVMLERARGDFYAQVLTPFRDLLAMDDPEHRLSARSQAVLERCLKEVQQWERVKDEEDYIPGALILFDLEEQTTHDVDLDEKYNTQDQLDRYAYDPEYEAHEKSYEEVRKVILGEDWETVLLQQVALDDEAYQEMEDAAEDRDDHYSPLGSTNDLTAQQAAADRSKPPIDDQERAIRKEVYLAMRSSVRADEAVHKILREMKPQTERTICFMVIEGCCEERSYKKMYGMVAERFCKSNSKFQAFFAEAFRERYAEAADLTIRQVEYTCKIYSHLLRTESLYWGRCLGVMDILNNDESQRLFIQNLFRALAEEMGMHVLTRRLQEDAELASQTTRLFPVNVPATEALEMAINLYAAMGLPELAGTLRSELEFRRDAIRKRPREPVVDDREYV